ncbi:hypothetical protein ABPG75_001933 [Micractinium tetrahymenae]
MQAGSLRLLAALLGLLIALALVPPASADSSVHQSSVIWAASNRDLRPVRWSAFKRVHYYQISENPVGTVVFFPGCARASRTFWPYQAGGCNECQGFPEEVAMTKMALARGYAVLTPTAKNKNGCWSSGGYYRRNDQMQAMTLMADFVLEHGLDRKPIFLVGSSSGATFSLKIPAYLHRFVTADRWVCSNETAPPPPAWRLPPGTKPPVTKPQRKSSGRVTCRDPYERWELPSMAKLRLLQSRIKGIVSMGSTPEAAEWGILRPNTRRLEVKPYPPVVWVAMSNDTWGMEMAPKCMKILRYNRVPSTYVLRAQRVGPTFFSDRTPTLTAEQSRLIVGALQQIGLLDRGGWLRANPKYNDRKGTAAYQWPEKLVRLLPWMTLGKSPTFSLDVYQSLVFQELNVAYGYHETVADYFLPSLVWLEANGQRRMGNLARSMRQYKLAALTADRYYPWNQRTKL